LRKALKVAVATVLIEVNLEFVADLESLVDKVGDGALAGGSWKDGVEALVELVTAVEKRDEAIVDSVGLNFRAAGRHRWFPWLTR
jgi:hypothetical protein